MWRWTQDEAFKYKRENPDWSGIIIVRMGRVQLMTALACEDAGG